MSDTTPAPLETKKPRKIKRLEGVTYLPRSSIIVNRNTRARRDHSQVLVNANIIAASIILVGPISPIVIDENLNLIAGECRYEAYGILGETEVPIVTRSKLNPAQQRMLELDENNARLKMPWTDIALAILEIHETNQEKVSKTKTEWTTRATGQLVGQSHSYVADCVKVAKELRRGDEQICSAKTMAIAMQIMLERREADIMKAQARISAGIPAAPSVPRAMAKSTPGIINITLGDPNSPPPNPSVIMVSPEEITEMQTVKLSDKLFNVNCVDFMMNTLPERCIDAILTDIPYGIDMDNLEDVHGVDQMRSTHEVEQNIEQMKPFLEGCYRVLKDNTFLMFFYAQQHQEKLSEWGRQAGFRVLDWNLLWLKPHSCKNNAPHQNPTKSYEPVMVMKKGSPHLAKPMIKCHMEVDGMPDKRLQSNPFAKPLKFVHEMMIDPIYFPGMTILDPFAGGGSMVRAFILKGAKPIACEISTDRFQELVNSVKGAYKNSLGGTVKFV